MVTSLNEINCYIGNGTTLPYIEAQIYCEDMGGRLPEFLDQSAYEAFIANLPYVLSYLFCKGRHAFLRQYQSPETDLVWLGMVQNNSSNSSLWDYYWDTKYQSISFQFWDEGNPDNTSDILCTALLSNISLWQSASCESTQIQAICQIDYVVSTS